MMTDFLNFTEVLSPFYIHHFMKALEYLLLRL